MRYLINTILIASVLLIAILSKIKTYKKIIMLTKAQWIDNKII